MMYRYYDKNAGLVETDEMYGILLAAHDGRMEYFDNKVTRDAAIKEQKQHLSDAFSEFKKNPSASMFERVQANMDLYQNLVKNIGVIRK